MTLPRAVVLALNAWTHQNRRAADDYYAHLDKPSEPVRRPSMKKTHCKWGHPFDEANTRLDSRGCQVCRACDRAEARRYRARKKAA